MFILRPGKINAAGIVIIVITGAVSGGHATEGALESGVEIEFQQQNGVDPGPRLRQVGLQKSGLDIIARVSVQDGAILRVRLRQAVFDNGIGCGVVHKPARYHDVLYFSREIVGSSAHRPEQIAGRQLRDAVVFFDQLRLQAFACALNPHQDHVQTHRLRSPLCNPLESGKKQSRAFMRLGS